MFFSILIFNRCCLYLGIRLRNFFFVVFFDVLLIKYTKNSIINSVILIDENSGRNAFRPEKKKRVPPISFVLDTTKYISMELQGRVPCKNYIPTMRYILFFLILEKYFRNKIIRFCCKKYIYTVVKEIYMI